MSIADIRQDYEKNVLHEHEAEQSPFKQFEIWFEQALAAAISEPTAMTLATVNADYQPSARIVLLKHYDQQGFVFFTNYESRKGQELALQTQACLLFFWPSLERQIQIQGVVEKTLAQESDTYYHSRPLASRLSAWASLQSQPIDRSTLEARMEQFITHFGDAPPRPAHWGGYRLIPKTFEFWQGRVNRLHDRLSYTLDHEAQWQITRLSP